MNLSLVNIRAAIPADIPFMMDLERASSTAAHWTEQQYRLLFQKAAEAAERLVLVVDMRPGGGPAAAGSISPGLLGFLIARHVAGEWELENVVVAPAARRRGIGKQLLDALLARARETNSEAVFLEVRESNTAARSLYDRAGFRQTGRRKSYYTEPAEGAILYRRVLGGPFSQ